MPHQSQPGDKIIARGRIVNTHRQRTFERFDQYGLSVSVVTGGTSIQARLEVPFGVAHAAEQVLPFK